MAIGNGPGNPITNWITEWRGDVGDLEPRLVQAVGILLDGCPTG